VLYGLYKYVSRTLVLLFVYFIYPELKFSGSKHNRLYNFLTGLFTTKVKREIQKNFEQKILQTTSDFNEFVAALVAHVKARPT
jgi:endonuclease III-like uncharacterized protein